MERTIFTNGLVFDGSGSPAAPGEVTVEADRVVSVTPGWSAAGERGAGRVIDVTGRTVMPGLIESHGHLTFPSAVGHIDPSFNPPVDVSFFRNIKGMEGELARAERNARIILDAGFTSVYSAGSLLPMPTEVILRDKIKAGVVPGPRQDSADARVARLFPTAAAYAARDRREQSWGEQLAAVLGGLPGPDRARLTAAVPALRRLAARLADDSPP